jgi:hypothetical protein
MSESTNLKTWSLKAQPDVALVGRKVLSSYGWCSHFVGEPVAYAIVKERAGHEPHLQELEQDSWSASDRLPSLNTRPRIIFQSKVSWAEKNSTDLQPTCQENLSFPP